VLSKINKQADTSLSCCDLRGSIAERSFVAFQPRRFRRCSIRSVKNKINKQAKQLKRRRVWGV
jgi:hypothetical protein